MHDQVTREVVELAYRLFLGRAPENQQVVDDKVGRHKSLSALAEDFTNSPEFRGRFPVRSQAALTGMEGAIQVQSRVSEAQQRRLFDHVQAAWSNLGEAEPHYSVLSSKEFLAESIAESEARFYSTGAHARDYLMHTLARNQVVVPPTATCLEFGCGVGRITKHLTGHFEKVYAYDISASHLRLAVEHFGRAGHENAEFRQLKMAADAERFPRVDVVYSVIVLQHNPPPLISYFYSALLRALKPGGVAVVQIPTYRADYAFEVESYLRDGVANDRGMEMHVLPQQDVFAIVETNGCRVLEVIEDRWTGEDRFRERSNTFVVQRS